MQKRISILSVLIMALTTMPFSAFADLFDDFRASQLGAMNSFRSKLEEEYQAQEERQEAEMEEQRKKACGFDVDLATSNLWENTSISEPNKYKQAVINDKEALNKYKKRYANVLNLSETTNLTNQKCTANTCKVTCNTLGATCKQGELLRECATSVYKCWQEEYVKAEYAIYMVQKVCPDMKEKDDTIALLTKKKEALVRDNVEKSSEPALSAEENKAIETEKYIKANGTMPPATSTKPAPAKPTSAKAGGAGAGPKKVVKPTQPATTAVAAPYAATNATVANPAYEDAPRPAHENIEKLTAPVNAPAAVKASDVNIVAKLPCEQEIRKYPHATGISGTTPNCVITDCENDYKVSRDKKSCEEMVNADYPDDYACEILENGQYDAANNNCECPESNEGWDAVHKICSASATRKTFDSSTQTTEPEQKTKKQLKQEAKDKKAQEKSAQKGCSGTGGKWENNTCKCPANNIWNASLQQCVVSRDAKIEACKKYGTWNDDMGTCNCKDSLAWSESSLKCVASDKLDIKDLSESQCNNREGATWDPTQGVCVALNQNRCTDGDKNCNKAVSKLEKSMEKDIGVLTKAFLSVVKSIVKKCEKDNGNFKDGECVIAQQSPEATETDDNNSNKNKRSKGGKRK